MPNIFSELKRRNVFRVAVAYVVIGWLLVQVLEVMVDAFEAPGWVLKTVIALLAVGFLPAMAFSWIYELTPEGLKRESEVDRSTSITRHTAHKLDIVTIAAVIVGVAFVAWTQLRAPSQPAVQPAGLTPESAPVLADAASVAVLPFINMSANADNQYFADGLTETLLHMLAQVRELKVAARTSSFAFKGREVDIREIAEALNVAHVLEGSVQRAGERVRITAQLIRASDGFHVWSENYDRNLDDVFQIQDEIAGDVRSALSTSLLGEETQVAIEGVGTENVEAYDLYLQALSEHTKGSYAALQEAERLLKSALVKDAGFLDAQTELALVLFDQSATGLITREERNERCGALLERVLERRPQDVRARTLQLVLRAFELSDAGDIPAGLVEFEKLVPLAEQAPSEPLPRQFLIRVFSAMNRLTEARRQLEVLLELDPLNPSHHRALGKIYVEEEAWSDATRALMRSLELEPEQPNVYGDLARIARTTGDVVGYVRNFGSAMQMDPEDHELPANVAEMCYDYRLVDIGDRFKAMTDAIAPTSPVARKLEMLRAIATGDMAAAERLARQMLADNVEDRHNSWFIAAETLFNSAGGKGDHEQALAFMNEHYPGYTDVSRTDLPPQAVFSRSVALGSLKATLPPEEFAEFLATYRHFLVTVAQEDIDNDPLHKALLLAAADQRQEAIEVLLSGVFSKPESRYNFVSELFVQPHLAPLRDDPRIVEALKGFEKEAESNRAKLLDYFNSKG